jgi:hypothetical protein
VGRPKRDAFKSDRAHTIYKNAAGKRVPGCTTIVGLRAKPQLVAWANRLGLQGVDSATYTDTRAAIGTCAHYLIQCHLSVETPDLTEYAPKVIDQAETALLKWLDWSKDRELEVVALEAPLVSEALQYGGTLDQIVRENGRTVLQDIKTAGSIYSEHWYQLAGYLLLAREGGYAVDSARIVRLSRDEDEPFEVVELSATSPKMDLYTQAFMALLRLYKVEGMIRRDHE